jgi:hypothetical protein
VERASAEAYVLTLYRELLAREPPEPEREGWVATLLGGTPPDTVRDTILDSEEYIERRRVIASREAIARTGLFDPSWYGSANPDVIAAGIDPLDHYARFGRLEGRAPNAYFVDHWYRERAHVPPGVDALLDYAERGEPLGLPPGPNFDPAWYREAYRLAPTVSPLAHFLARKATGRFAPTPWLWSVATLPADPDASRTGDPLLPYLVSSDDLMATAAPDRALLAESGLFDENYYLVANHDVADAEMDPLSHFCAFGWKENRNPNAYFDLRWYVSTNPEVARLCVNPLVHYTLLGEARDRRPVVYFEPEWYRRTYGLAENASPLAHYLANRFGQRVSPNSLFDAEWFVARNRQKLNGRRDPFAHYLFAGTWEDLQPSPDFDALAWRKRTKGRRSRHFRTLLHPDRDNPLVDYMMSTYR